MASADDYKREQDLFFEKIEEKARLALQARDAKIADVMKRKRMQKYIAVLARAKGISPEEYQKRMEKGLRELDTDSN